jgi:hypothetical protein
MIAMEGGGGSHDTASPIPDYFPLSGSCLPASGGTSPTGGTPRSLGASSAPRFPRVFTELRCRACRGLSRWTRIQLWNVVDRSFRAGFRQAGLYRLDALAVVIHRRGR